MRIVIIGAGKVGYSLARMLSAEEHDVIVVEPEIERGNIINEKLDVQVVNGNGASPRLQRAIDIGNADLVIAVTDRDNVNIIVSEMAKQMFNVTKVIARLSDPQRSCVYQQLGIETICPSVLSARQVDHILNHDTESISEAQV